MGCESPEKRDEMEEAESGSQDYFLVVSSDTMGKDDDIGGVLVKGFFDTINATGETPHSIFFLNAGVRLTTLNEEIVPVLQEIEKKGVQIFSCGTCLKHYGLEKSLKVGHRGSTDILVGSLKDLRTVWV